MEDRLHVLPSTKPQIATKPQVCSYHMADREHCGRSIALKITDGADPEGIQNSFEQPDVTHSRVHFLELPHCEMAAPPERPLGTNLSARWSVSAMDISAMASVTDVTT
jgi:hypothetical protein